MYRTAVEGAPDRLRQVRHLRVWDVERTIVPVHSTFQQGESAASRSNYRVPRGDTAYAGGPSPIEIPSFRPYRFVTVLSGGRSSTAYRNIRSVRLRYEYGNRVPVSRVPETGLLIRFVRSANFRRPYKSRLPIVNDYNTSFSYATKNWKISNKVCYTVPFIMFNSDNNVVIAI